MQAQVVGWELVADAAEVEQADPAAVGSAAGLAAAEVDLAVVAAEVHVVVVAEEVLAQVAPMASPAATPAEVAGNGYAHSKVS